MTGISAVCQSSLISRAATYPDSRGICTSRMITSGWERKAPCTASTPSSAMTTVWPARSSTVDTMRRSVGLSSAMSTVGIGWPRISERSRGGVRRSAPEQATDRIDEFGLVELALEQVGAGTCVQAGPLVGLVAPRGHDHDGDVLPAAGGPQRAGERESVHPRHLHVGEDQVDRGLPEPSGAVQPVHGRDHLVAGAFEDHPL